MVPEKTDRRKPLQVSVYRIPMLSKWFLMLVIPIGSMYGIFTYIYHKKTQLNVGKIYKSHGSNGIGFIQFQ